MHGAVSINPNAIAKISVYGVAIPFHALGSRWVGRDKPDHLDSTIVIIETRSGLSGVGESCPIGAIYLPAFAVGLRAALEEMAPALLGQDATQINQVNRVMDETLFGHVYAKAVIDIACWDLLGKHCAQPLSQLLGGRFQSRIPAYASIPLRTPDDMVAMLKQKQSEGFTRFQIKIGDDPIEDCERVRAVVAAGRDGDLFMADANRGWSQADALRAVGQINQIDCYLEQPCATYRECLPVRERCTRPFILDEVIDSPQELARAIADDALDALVIKVTHAGGLTPAKIQRDLCLSHGIKMRLEDTAGTEITRAAQAQLAAATPLSLQLGSYTFVNDRPATADGAPEVLNGMLHLNHEPGLGVTPKMDVLGEALAVYA
ncbi:MAG: mandelate racemase/muconate lactonizing enzyme family protein [Gammaproteobacteria bacterium]|nr:MAG: mandelate racemase [Gammaproteobacteria bacterium]UCH40526.1 MAG: mandelate racemase/muconate lactonizing enzyme family protein [Gammaproteobacteria bacterium]